MIAAASFDPHVGADCRILICGSLPGMASLQARQYYAHPRNLFWQLLGEVLQCELATIPYDHRLACLTRHRIGLWDVVRSAHRHGSLDTAIRNAELNDLAAMVHSVPALRAIAFNGGKAHSSGQRLLPDPTRPLLALPSSSPAYASMPYARKRDCWLALRNYL